MSFYTALTGLNAATSQLGVTSNNIANVGTTGFKRSRADFGDIFATSPLQKASSVVGQGVALKSVTQEFSQGNIQFSASSLDIAITGDGFFPLKSADGLQDIYTRNGTFLLDDSFAVVNSAGQALMAASVDSSGKADLENLRKLIIPRATTGDARETTAIELGLNLPADGEVITADFNPKDPTTYNLTTAVTVFDAGGNEYLATVYYAKTQRATPEDPFNKWQTHVYIGETKLDELLIQASDQTGEALYVNKYGQVRSEGEIPPQDIARGVTKLFNIDNLKNKNASIPAERQGAEINGTIVQKMKSGTFDVHDEVAAALGPADSRTIAFEINVDRSPTPVRVDLSDLYSEGAPSLSGVELARELENRINKAYGDQGTFDLSDLVASDGSTVVNLFTVRVDDGTTVEDIDISIDTAGYDINALRIEDLEVLVQDALSDSATGFGTLAPTFSYDAASQTVLFESASGTNVSVKAFAPTATNEVFDLTSSFSAVDSDSFSYGGLVIPNGASTRDYESTYEDSDQRTGIRVRFDDTTGTFSIFSGTTGDESSLEILHPLSKNFDLSDQGDATTPNQVNFFTMQITDSLGNTSEENISFAFPTATDLSTVSIDELEDAIQSALDDVFPTGQTPTVQYSAAERKLKFVAPEGIFNLNGLADNTISTQVNLFTMTVEDTSVNPSVSASAGITFNFGSSMQSAGFDPTDADDVASFLSAISIADLEDAIQESLDAEFGSDAPTVQYSESERKMKFTLAEDTTVSLKAFTGTTSNEIFDLTDTDSEVDPDTGEYDGIVVPTSIAIQLKAFTGTESSELFDLTSDFSKVNSVTHVYEGDVLTTRLDASTYQDESEAESGEGPELQAFQAFQAIFNFEPDVTDRELLPTRGVRSLPAVVSGTPIGLNLDNKFTLTADTSRFTITVDNVTGLIELPVGQEFTKESFRELLELRINALEDSRGRTVNGVRVSYETQGSATVLKITTGTEGNDSFLKVTGPSIWGLSDLPSGRGSTETWLEPPQAETANGVPLYVDRDGNETTEAGDFSEEETRELWSPIFLDKGELTFTTAGNLSSPAVPIAFKASTIGDTGATLKFSINYDGSTQYSSPFSVLAQDQNGRPEGDLIGLDIGDDGLVSANYSNGTQKNLAKVILANFTAPTGLRQIGDASYYATSQSGAVTLGEAGTAGFGTVRAGARERANVDLTQELIELITAQRNFQANAKAIETNNTLTQAIINIRS